MSGFSTREDDRDRLDALLSAERDGALEPSERASLEERLSDDPQARTRRAELASVDEALRSLAEPLDDAVLEAGLAALRARTADSRDDERRPGGLGRFLLRPAAGAALAAAAALTLFLSFGSPPEGVVPGPREDLDLVAIPGEPAETTGSAAFPGADLETSYPGFDEDMAIALGYGEASSLVPGVDDADLPVIDALDVLDFMSAQSEADAEGRG